MFWFRCARKCTFILHSRSTWLHIYVCIYPMSAYASLAVRTLRLRRAMINHPEDNAREELLCTYVAASLLLLATVRSFYTRNTYGCQQVSYCQSAGCPGTRPCTSPREKGLTYICMHGNLYWRWPSVRLCYKSYFFKLINNIFITNK
jgi:hypothetical protein